MTSRRSETSSPIFVISPQPQGQSVLFGSITRSIRGRCGGRWPRFRLGGGCSAPGVLPFSAASAFSWAAASMPSAMASSSSGRLNCSGESFSERAANFSRCIWRTIFSSRSCASRDSARAASVSASCAFSLAFSAMSETSFISNIIHAAERFANQNKPPESSCRS